MVYCVRSSTLTQVSQQKRARKNTPLTYKYEAAFGTAKPFAYDRERWNKRRKMQYTSQFQCLSWAQYGSVGGLFLDFTRLVSRIVVSMLRRTVVCLNLAILFEMCTPHDLIYFDWHGMVSFRFVAATASLQNINRPLSPWFWCHRVFISRSHPGYIKLSMSSLLSIVFNCETCAFCMPKLKWWL